MTYISGRQKWKAKKEAEVQGENGAMPSYSKHKEARIHDCQKLTTEHNRAFNPNIYQSCSQQRDNR